MQEQFTLQSVTNQFKKPPPKNQQTKGLNAFIVLLDRTEDIYEQYLIDSQQEFVEQQFLAFLDNLEYAKNQLRNAAYGLKLSSELAGRYSTLLDNIKRLQNFISERYRNQSTKNKQKPALKPKPMQESMSMKKSAVELSNQIEEDVFKQIDRNNQQKHKRIAAFINKNSKNLLVEDLQILKSHLKKQFLSPKAIQVEKMTILNSIFYFPTDQLVDQLRIQGKQISSILFKTIVMRHGDLLNLSMNWNPLLKQQVNHVIKSVFSWGDLYVDVTKLQKLSNSKQGTSQHKKYRIDDFQLEFHIFTKTINHITVNHNGKVIEPNNFRFNVLNQLAESKAKSKATQMYYKYLKKAQSQ